MAQWFYFRIQKEDWSSKPYLCYMVWLYVYMMIQYKEWLHVLVIISDQTLPKTGYAATENLREDNISDLGGTLSSHHEYIEAFVFRLFI